MDKDGYDEENEAREEKPRKGRRVRRQEEPEPEEDNSNNAYNRTASKPAAEPSGGGGSRFRRRRQVEEQQDEEDVENNTTTPKGGGGGGGWMDSPAAKAPTRDEEDADDFREDSVKNNSKNKNKHFQEDNDAEIIVIPELEDDGGMDGDQRVAHAPRNLNRKIPTKTELETEVKASIPINEGGFDLSILLGTLVPAEMVKEDDSPWTFESLLRDITVELSEPKTSSGNSKNGTPAQQVVSKNNFEKKNSFAPIS